MYILHEERRIGATCEISKDDKRQVIELALEPVCHVHGKLDSEDLKKVGRPLTRTNVYLSEVQDPAEKEERLIQLLDNISRQTNLQFKVEMRPVEKWFVAEQND